MTNTLFASITITDDQPIDNTEAGYPIVVNHRVIENTTFITIKIPKGESRLFNDVLRRVHAVLIQAL